MPGSSSGRWGRRLVFSTWVGLLIGGLALMLAVPLLGR